MKNKRGFTVMEAVVALAVIVLVSMTVLSIISSSIRSSVKNSYKQRAEIIACNVIEAHRFAKASGMSSEEFENSRLLDFAQANDADFEVGIDYGNIGESENWLSAKSYSITVTVWQGETELYSYTYNVEGE